jgi:murein DD-endopeptidase MepM/ murein hydrolase activator NlpD
MPIEVLRRILLHLSTSEDGRKKLATIITSFFVFILFMVSIVGSILMAPTDMLTSFFGEEEATKIEAFRGEYQYLNEFPPDAVNIKQTGTYPWPLNGRVTSPYGPRPSLSKSGFHQGIDISTGKNDPIIAVADGTVYRVAADPDSYGMYVIIKHDDGLYSVYAHLAKIYVQKGDRVTARDTIALEGGGKKDPMPGHSTGRHLHFEIRTGPTIKYAVNPIKYLK